MNPQARPGIPRQGAIPPRHTPRPVLPGSAPSTRASRACTGANPVGVLLALLLACVGLHLPTPTRATLYRAGDIVEDFTLTRRNTHEPVRLTDFAGHIVVLDWFAWWCPFCQAAAPQMRSGIHDHYQARGGNPAGIPVLHIGVNLQPGQETQTANFVERAGFEIVLEDFSRAVANRIATGGQPLFAIINGVTNSPSHSPWELLYSRAGYGQTTFPIAEFQAAIDAVHAPPPQPPKPATLSHPALHPDGTLTLRLVGEAGRTYRIQSTTDLAAWREELSLVATGIPQSLTLASPSPTPVATLIRAVSP